MVMRLPIVLLSFATLLTAADRPPAPDFTLPGENGAPVKLSRYQGKVVLLDFWATWCHGCKTEIPWYMEFSEKYRKNGLVVIGNDELGKRYSLDEMPLTLLIDRHGNIAYRHSGVVDKDAFEGELRNLLTAAH